MPIDTLCETWPIPPAADGIQGELTIGLSEVAWARTQTGQSEQLVSRVVFTALWLAIAVALFFLSTVVKGDAGPLSCVAFGVMSVLLAAVCLMVPLTTVLNVKLSTEGLVFKFTHVPVFSIRARSGSAVLRWEQVLAISVEQLSDESIGDYDAACIRLKANPSGPLPKCVQLHMPSEAVAQQWAAGANRLFKLATDAGSGTNM